MADKFLSKTKIGDTTYLLKDSEARTLIDTANTSITNLQNNKQDKITSTNKLASDLVSASPAAGSKLTYIDVSGALQQLETAIDTGGTGSVVSVVKQETAETDYAATYYVTQGGEQVGAKINIPKDYLVKSATLETVTEADKPYEGAKVGDKYIDFVVNSKDTSSTASHIYLPVNDLVDVYKADETTLTLNSSTNTFSVKAVPISSVTNLQTALDTKASTTALTAETNRATAAEALKANTADLGAFAAVDTGSATVASKTVSGVKATGSVTGSASVTLKQTSTAAILTTADYTPSGSITGSAINGGSISVTLADDTTASAASLTTADYTPAGTVGVTLKNATVSEITSVGTLPSKAADTFTANTPTKIDISKFNGGSSATYSHTGFSGGSLGAATTGTFATAGIIASVDETNEALIFTNASTGSAVTKQGTFTAAVYGTDNFNGGSAASLSDGFYTAGSAASYTEGKFNQGTLPTKSNKTIAVDSTSFTGTTAEGLQVIGVDYVKPVVNSATFTGTEATLGFAGTQVKKALVTGVNYDKASVNSASITMDAVSLNVGDITVPSQTITVSPSEEVDTSPEPRGYQGQ